MSAGDERRRKTGAAEPERLSGGASPSERVRPWFLILSCIATLVAMLTLRLLGPSDLYDQTQPKTIAYTTDIIVHGGTHWLLPIERGRLPATKPPLYNWLAVPGVKWLGFSSEVAHKLPSIAAMLACWLILVRLPRSWIAPPAGLLRGPVASDSIRAESLGWLAAMIFVSTYAVFKLGYLARPDMLLTLWLLIAWWCATHVYSSHHPPVGGNRRALLVTFWVAIVLAGLTKGPAALVMIVYVILAARIIAGRWSAVRLLHPIAGGLFALLACGAWAIAVWKIDPQHLKQELWFNEIYGRFTGSGREGTHHGSRQWLSEIHYQSFYFVTRFVPWSLVALAGAIALWWRRRSQIDTYRDVTTGPSQLDRWMPAALLFAVLVVGIFSLSVGKRADYVAVAYPQTALLAAWFLLHGWGRVGIRLPWLPPVTVALNLASISIYDHRQIWAPVPGFGDAIRRFVDESSAAIAARPAPIMHCSAGQSHLQAVLGMASDDQRREIPEAIARGEVFWVVAGRTQNPPYEFDRWLEQRRLPANAEHVVRSADLPRADGWPGQVTLWRVIPGASLQ